MFRRVLLVVLSALLPIVAQAQVKLLRHPSYSKGKVAFSYLGDIWTASETGADVQRLTDNKARDQFPRFSPDGQWIAFSSNRDGNYDVYVIAGGRRQAEAAHVPQRRRRRWWAGRPTARRSSSPPRAAMACFRRIATLWEIPVEGGIETPVNTDWGASAASRRMARRWPSRAIPATWSRKHYRGSYAADLWVEDLPRKSSPSSATPNTRATCYGPCMATAARSISSRTNCRTRRASSSAAPEVMKSVNNIWKIPDKGGKPVKVTNHGDGNLFFPTHFGRREDHCLRRQLRHLEAGRGQRQEQRNPHRHQDRPQGKRYRAGHASAMRPRVSACRRPTSARPLSVHGEIFTIATGSRRAAARQRYAVERAESALVAQWKVDRVRFRPHGPRGDFHFRRTGQEMPRSSATWIAIRSAIVVVAGFEVAAVDRARTTSCGAWMWTAAKTKCW